MGGALFRASPRVDALDVDAAVLHRFDAGDLDQLARGEVPLPDPDLAGTPSGGPAAYSS